MKVNVKHTISAVDVSQLRASYFILEEDLAEREPRVFYARSNGAVYALHPHTIEEWWSLPGKGFKVELEEVNVKMLQ